MAFLFCAAGIARNFTAIGTKMAAAGAENASFCPILNTKRSFYQDRLGTNIGKESTQTEGAFSFRLPYSLCGQMVKKTYFSSHLYIKPDHFTKTGSGQT
eukprot:COSAG06_NODE_5258_length_3604_cov_147.017689_1_plen_99_part_00